MPTGRSSLRYHGARSIRIITEQVLTAWPERSGVFRAVVISQSQRSTVATATTVAARKRLPVARRFDPRSRRTGGGGGDERARVRRVAHSIRSSTDRQSPAALRRGVPAMETDKVRRKVAVDGAPRRPIPPHRKTIVV